MKIHEELSYSNQLVLVNHTLRLEALPYEVLEISELKDAWLKLDIEVRQRLSLLWCRHYRALAWWFRFLLLGIYEPLSNDEFKVFLDIRLEAEFVIARFFWGQRVYSLLPLAQEFNSPEEFCYALDASDFIKRIELAGVTGLPALNKEGRLLGKVEGLELDIAALQAYKRDFEEAQSGDFYLSDMEDLKSCDLVYEPTLTEAFLANALYLARESEGDDSELASACSELLEAKLKLQRIIRKGKSAASAAVYYLRSPNQLFVTRKGVKTPRPDFVQKRGRGRPPKGSTVKKY